MTKCAIAAGVATAALLVGSAYAADLRVGLGAETTSIDPHYFAGFGNIQIDLAIFGHLVNYDSKFRIMPGLAESWKSIDDKTWEFKIRSNAKWHDGSPVTVDDVIHTFKRIPETGLKQFAVYVVDKQIVKIDDKTFHLKTQVPNPLMPNNMAAFALVSKKHSEGLATEDFNSGKAAIGAGPFKFVEWVKGDRLVLTANPDYWAGKPGFDKVTLKPIGSSASRVASMLAGEVDMIEKVPAPDIAKLKQNANLTVVQTPSCRVMMLHPDASRESSPYVTGLDDKPIRNPFRDSRVRMAVSKAINRDAIVSRVLDGNGVAASQHLAPGLFGHNPNIKVEAYDPEGAKKLLQAAGYGQGFKLTIHGTNDRYDNDGQILEALGQMLSQVGIQTKVEPLSLTVFFGRLYGKVEFSLAMAGNCPGTAEASSSLKEFVATFNASDGYGINNAHRYSNPRIDAIIKEAVSTIDDPKREKLFQEALAAAIADGIPIPLHQQMNTWAMRKGMTYEARTDEMTLVQFARPN